MMVRLGLPVSPGVLPLEMTVTNQGCNQRRDFEMQSDVRISGESMRVLIPLARRFCVVILRGKGVIVGIIFYVQTFICTLFPFLVIFYFCFQTISHHFIVFLVCRELFLRLLPPPGHCVGPTSGVGISTALPPHCLAGGRSPTLSVGRGWEEKALIPRASCKDKNRPNNLISHLPPLET